MYKGWVRHTHINYSFDDVSFVRYDRDFDFDKKDSFSSWGNNNKSGSWDIDRFDSKQSFSDTLSSKSKDDDK